jgi:hypothetical protein
MIFKNDDFDKYLRKYSWTFSDELTELILSYISFEDKIILERVSKQFQRTIFKKQYNIEFTGYEMEIYLFKKTINIKDIEFIFKKCLNIKIIDINGYINDNIFNNLIYLLIKYNNCMNTFRCRNNLNLLPNKTLNSFIKKFESKLESFYYCFDHLDNFNYSYMKSFNYIKSITGRIALNQLFNDKNEIIFNNLYEVEII